MRMRSARRWRRLWSTNAKVFVVGFHLERAVHFVHCCARAFGLQSVVNLFLHLIKCWMIFADNFVHIVSARIVDHLRNLDYLQVKHRDLRRTLGRLTVGDSIFIPAAAKASFCSLTKSSPAAARSRRV